MQNQYIILFLPNMYIYLQYEYNYRHTYVSNETVIPVPIVNISCVNCCRPVCQAYLLCDQINISTQ